MTDQDECTKEQEYSFKPHREAQVLSSVFQELTLGFDHLDNSHQSCQFNKFVHPADPCDPYKLIEIARRSFENEIKWKNSQKINEEP